MQNTIGVVQVRQDQPLASSILGRRLGGVSLLELVVRRLTDCERLDKVIVLAAPQHVAAVRPLVPPDVPLCPGASRDALASIAAALERFHCQSLVRVAADNPFVDPVLIDRLVITSDAHPACDYIGYQCADGRPAILAKLGIVAEWCRAAALQRAHREARQPADRDSVTSFLYGHPETFNVRLIPLPAALDRDDLRLGVGDENDWEHAQVIYDALGTHDCDWQHIAGLLDHQPALRSRMADLNRATA